MTGTRCRRRSRPATSSTVRPGRPADFRLVHRLRRRVPRGPPQAQGRARRRGRQLLPRRSRRGRRPPGRAGPGRGDLHRPVGRRRRAWPWTRPPPTPSAWPPACPWPTRPSSARPPPLDFEGPYIVKPRFGGSSIGIEVVDDLATAQALLASLPPPARRRRHRAPPDRLGRSEHRRPRLPRARGVGHRAAAAQARRLDLHLRREVPERLGRGHGARPPGAAGPAARGGGRTPSARRRSP